MDAPRQKSFRGLVAGIPAAIRDAWTLIRQRGPGSIQFWFIALVIGIAAGYAAVLFRLGINFIQESLYAISMKIKIILESMQMFIANQSNWLRRLFWLQIRMT